MALNTSSYPTAAPSHDPLGLNLAETSGQRGAEILAGIRDILTPSPESRLLCNTRGRLAAQMVLRLEKNKAALNFVAARLIGITALVQRSLQSDRPNPVIVDIAAGFSPRGLQLARLLPHAEIIEIDLPAVIKQKKQRLERSADGLPKNLTWLSADLGVTPLAEVLENRQVDVVSAEGLNAYFSPANITRIAAAIRDSLIPGGSYISDIPWQTGMEQARTGTLIFSKQAGKFFGVLPSSNDMCVVMMKAGYRAVEVYEPSKYAEMFNLPTPLLDFSFFVVAKK